MKKMRIMICDDEQLWVDELTKHCEAYFEKVDMKVDLVGTRHFEDIFKDPCDLLLLDIEMPGMSGIEIKEHFMYSERPLIIFVTAYPEYIGEAFGRNVIGFLTKPIQTKQFETYLSVAMNLHDIDTYVTFEDGSVRSSREILLITVKFGYADVVMVTGERYSSIRKSLKIWQEELGHYGFIRINDACLVNCRYIKSFKGTHVLLQNEQMHLVSRRRKKECVAQFIEYSKKIAKHL